MPHILADRRQYCDNLIGVKSWGELHYFFGQQMQLQFLANPCYDTIRNIRRFFVQTAHRQDYFKKVRQALRCPMDDVLNEADLAWEIFTAEVVVPYEDVKALENGHAYQKSLEVIRKKLDEVMVKKQTTGLILPNEVKK